MTLPILLVLFSLNGFSQTTEKSAHPLLDKYYPRPHTDTPKTVTPEVKPVTQTEPVTAAPAVPVPAAATAIQTPAPQVTPAAAQAKVTQPVPANKAIADTVTVHKVQPQLPSTPPFRSTRLGSSSKLYDTWEKNSNGAGSVTTNPK